MNKINLCGIGTCTQCYACASVCPKNCIRLVEEKDGFSVPVIDTNQCVECGACVKSCHQLSVFCREPQNPLRTYAAWSLKDNVRRKSSSGGVFSVLAERILEAGGLVFGAVMDNQLQVCHQKAETVQEMALMRGSKYLQSNIEGVYKHIKKGLIAGRKVMMVGTPCQIAGLYAFLKHDYDNLITCDLVCHGVPSQKAFDIYCNRIGVRKEGVVEVGFRYTKGWGLQMTTRKHQAEAANADYEWKNISPQNSYYLRAFNKGLMFNEACYTCKYARPERIGDFTLADFWGIGQAKPFDHPTKKGVSLLLVNNDKAADFLSQCNELFLEERDYSEAVAGNYNLCNVSGRPQGRDFYFEDSRDLSIKCIISKYQLQPSWKDYLRPLKRKFITD